jgi:hypothetical protein
MLVQFSDRADVTFGIRGQPQFRHATAIDQFLKLITPERPRLRRLCRRFLFHESKHCFFLARMALIANGLCDGKTAETNQ